MAAFGIPLAIGLGSQLVNWAAQGSANRKARKWAEHMYDRQRQDALADWNMMNAYNHPSAQMARFRDANLNPNLIYGQMQETGPVRGSNPDSWKPEPGRIDVQGAISQYADMRLKEAQTNLTMEYATTQQEEQQLKRMQQMATAAQTAKTQADTDTAKFGLDLAGALREFNINAAKLNNQKMGEEIAKITAEKGKVEADTQFTKDQNARAKAQELRNAALHTHNLKEAAYRAISAFYGSKVSEQQLREIHGKLELLDYDREFKALEAEFRRSGINLNDSWWLRLSKKIFDRFGPKFDNSGGNR